MDEALRREGWFLGDSTEDTAESILKTSGAPNTFVVYKTQDGRYLISARFPVEGVAEDLVETLQILTTDDGKVYLSGQSEPNENVIEVINMFTNSRDPPLQPALGRKEHLALQLSISEPPAYDEANRNLKPDVAPLPNISSITPDLAVEAQPGRISPTSSIRLTNRDLSSILNARRSARPVTPPHIHQPHWWRYRNKSCCHPHNVCHCLCYRETRWDGYEEEAVRNWYDCRNTGPLRCLLISAMWALGWPFALCGLCVALCVFLCYLCCCYEEDD